jgi:hypothetical protein
METYIHPTQMTSGQRRENTANVFDRIARAHEKVAAQGKQTQHQKMCAASARKAADKIRNV